jgi:hypothetical protein
MTKRIAKGVAGGLIVVPIQKEVGDTGQGAGNSPQGTGGYGNCVCTKCSYKAKHTKGTPCNKKICPKCGAPMTGTNK